MKYLTAFALLIALSACEPADPKPAYHTPYVYVDPGTGCHYLQAKGALKGTPTGSLIPRMNANGGHMCLSVVTVAR